jgi:myo-inositol-1(or 4)-monophosphatase
MNRLLANVIDIVQKAGNVLLQNQKKVIRIRETKKDFLTGEDIASNGIILPGLYDIDPEIPVYSEEKKSGVVKTLRNIRIIPKILKRGKFWVVDSLDGTINFFHQDVFWGVTVALVEDGLVQLAVINLPALKWLVGVVRSGEIIVKGDIDFGVRKDEELSQAQVWTDWTKEKDELTIQTFNKLAKVTLRPQVRLCSSAAYLAVATGHIAGFVDPFAPIDDMAAGSLIVEMAGGKVTDLQGKPWNIFLESIVASNGILHNQILKGIK